MCLWLYTLVRVTQYVVACRVSCLDFPATVLLMPADIRCVDLQFDAPMPQPGRQCPDLAPLSRLTQLEELHLATQLEELYLAFPTDQPLPQLPALHILRVQTADPQALFSVTATLEWLMLVAPDIDFEQPYTLAYFACFKGLDVDAQTIRNLKPEVLPPSLHDITLAYTEWHAMPDENLAPVFPVVGTVDRDVGDGDHLHQYAGSIIRWTHNSPL